MERNMRVELKSIGVWAFIKVAFFVNIILGFIVGIIYALFFSFILAIMQNLPYMPSEEIAPPSDTPFGFIVVFLPFLFALIGGFFYTMAGVILVVIYNLVVKLTGGMEFNLNQIAEIVPVPQPVYAQTQMAPVAPPPPPPIAENPPYPPTAEPRPPQDSPGNDFPSRTVGG